MHTLHGKKIVAAPFAAVDARHERRHRLVRRPRLQLVERRLALPALAAPKLVGGGFLCLAALHLEHHLLADLLVLLAQLWGAAGVFE